MSRMILALCLLLLVSCAKQEKTTTTARSASETVQKSAAAAKCEHGVDSALCTRCTPALAAAFKSKGDWCVEHDRPESQCVLCHPELAQLGVK